MKKMLNGQLIEMTAEEITAKADDEAKSAAETAEAVAQQDAEAAILATNKANAKAKLIAGEALTEAEADTVLI